MPWFLRYIVIDGLRRAPTRRIHRRTTSGSTAALLQRRVYVMAIVVVFALLALFSIISIVMSAGESERPADPRENPLLWATLGRR